ncbi:MAG: CoB--CoM heterodisulfide reductase iron-sulfur subunit B family protein [Candidatus Bathyarchaeia archaeon]
MKYSLFLGCTIPARQANYELSTRLVARELGVELVDRDFGCCGFPVESIDEVKAIAMAAANLKKAAELGLEVVTLCSACNETLNKAGEVLAKDSAMLGKVNRLLRKQLGVEYWNERPRVVHFVRMLYESFGVERIRKVIKKPLDGLKVAVHYGCHYLRPSTLYGGFDDPEFPKSLDELVTATGAESIDYPGKNDCCGGGILAVGEGISKGMTRKKLDAISKFRVDCMVLICPFCSVMYDRYQSLIASEFCKDYQIPVLYYPQLLGLALGIEKQSLGFDINSVKVDKLLEKVGA